MSESATLPLAAPLGNWRRARWAVATLFFVNGAAFASWVARIPALRANLGLSDGALGGVLFALSAGVLVSFPIAGRGVRLAGARPLALVAALLTLALLPVPFLVGIVPSLALVLFEIGVANGITDIAMNVLAVDVQARMGRPIMSSLHGVWSAGGVAGAAIGSVAAHAGIAPALHLGAVAAMLGIALVGVSPWLGAVQAAAGAAAQPAAPRPAGRRFDRVLVGLGLVCFCSFLVEGAMADWGAVYLRDSLHTSESRAAVGYAVFAAAMTCMRLAGDRVLARFGAARVLRLLDALGAVALAGALLLGRADATLVAFALVGLGLATVVPCVFSAAARHAQEAHAVAPGGAIALMAGFGYTGFLVGPPLIGALAQASSLRLALAFPAVLVAAIAVLAPLVGRTPAARPD
jgi:predicted MFS family arabinose efflux permease